MPTYCTQNELLTGNSFHYLLWPPVTFYQVSRLTEIGHVNEKRSSDCDVVSAAASIEMINDK